MAATAVDLPMRNPVLPPGFAAVVLDRAGAAFAHACDIALEAGAATLVFVRRTDVVEFAVVLEPDAPLPQALQAHYLAMTAVADTLASHGPPERGIAFRWPDAILFDGGLIGGGRTAWPEGTPEGAVPDWLVFGAMVRISARLDFEEDATRRSVAMDEAGFEETDAVDLIESFARHLLRGVSEWQAQSLQATAARWLERLEPVEGTRHGIDANGDLLAVTDGRKQRRSLVEALARADWYDPVHAEPKL